ncbi:hypothetical protein [Bacteroides acidifaciens]|uniref:hypothetical protein n=1 Tax=Bacteroides acidifaciens TaxID=85831 RepID=UPI00262CF4DD|nr:hypothetical protein [Bacteroides acidifaciens]
MNDNKDLILAILAVLVPALVAFMGYIIHRKTERIKIMENQLSEKKYLAYAGIVTLFFNILKTVKAGKTSDDDWAGKMVDLKRDILLYGSESVFYAFNNFFDVSTNHPGDIKLMMDVWLKLILEIRQDMCGHKSKLSKDDILLNLMQSRNEIQKFYNL